MPPSPCSAPTTFLLLLLLLVFPPAARGDAGVIRSLVVEPPGCGLRPRPFKPEAPSGHAFYMVECPVSAGRISLTMMSSFRLYGVDGRGVPSTLSFALASGEAKLVQVHACAGGSTSGPACTFYQFDVRRAASTQAELAQLLVTTNGGQQDCALSPPFSPGVPAYKAEIPHGAEADINVEAANGGYVSFTSFAAAEHHSLSKHIGPSGRHARHMVNVYVVAPNRQGQRTYRVILKHRASRETALSTVRSNVGKVLPLGDPHDHQFLLKVPLHASQVAISATAKDREGASVTLHGRSGKGFVSAIVALRRHAPYELVHLRVTAADRASIGSYIIIVCHHFHSVALLSSLVVPGCRDGLHPKFGMFAYEYFCGLGKHAQELTVVPTSMWLPRGETPVRLSIGGASADSGEAWSTPLDDDGNAEVHILVKAADGVHNASYHVLAKGYPLSIRSPPTSTTTTTTATPTTTTASTTTSSGLSAYTAYTTSHAGASRGSADRTTTTTSGDASREAFTVKHRPWWQNHHWHLPNLHTPDFGFRNLSIPRLHRPHWHISPPHIPEIPPYVFTAIFKSLAMSSSFAVVLGSPNLVTSVLVVKHIQFAVLATEVVAPRSLTGQLAQPLGVFSLLLPLSTSENVAEDNSSAPHEEEQTDRKPWEDEEETERKLSEEEEEEHVDMDLAVCRRHAGCLKVFSVLLAIAGLLLIWGWHNASGEEALTKQGLHPRLAPRLRLLPCALALLDFAVIPVTDAVAYFLLQSKGGAACAGFPAGRLPLLLACPAAFAALSLLQLCRLSAAGRLVWGRRFERFGDAECLAVTLRGPWYTAASSSSRLPAVVSLACCRELRNALPVADPDGGPLCFGEEGGARGTAAPEGLLSVERAEAEAGLLPRQLRPSAAWRRRQRHLELLLWMERRCAAHEALKQQIEGAEQHMAITDVQGLQILDALGEPLTNLYQYCVYQFPWRPWRAEASSAAPEPYEFEGGILAPWVPPAEEIGEAERALVDAWLERWLTEAETVIRAREEWRQLRVRELNAQTREQGFAVLREMSLAVLESLPLRQAGQQRLAEDAEERELRLGELVQERLSKGLPVPWYPDWDGAGTLEAFVTLRTETPAGRDLLLRDTHVRQPALAGAVLGLKHLYVHSTAEASRLDVAPSLDAVVRHFAVGPGTGGPLRTRRTHVACELPLRHLHLLARWMPPFGFSVCYDSLAMPVRESWAPLFATFSGTGVPPGALLVDSLERGVSILAVLAVRLVAGEEQAPLSPALVLVLWSFALLALRFLICGGMRWCFIWVPQALLSAALCVMSYQPPTDWRMAVLDRACAGAAVVALLLLAWYTLRELVAGIARAMPVRSRRLDSGEFGPPWGTFSSMEGPMRYLVSVPLLGMSLHGEARHTAGLSTDERRRAMCRKQFAVYEAPPDSGIGSGQRVPGVDRLAEIQRALPLAISRAQLAGTEEIHELACTIHVVNHVGCIWSSMRHDSFLSLYKPWGMDLQPAREKECYGTAERSEQQDKTQQTVERSALLKAWHQEVIDWLHGELAAAGTVQHTALDAMLHGGRLDRGPFKLESDRRVIPGIFSNEGIGEQRHTESRCFREGRVLHYVIPSTQLKAGFVWRPDPLATETAELLAGDQWRPCLLRLTSRSVSYLLRKSDGCEQGGEYPDWREPVLRDHGDLLEHNVSFLFLDRIEVEVEERLVMLQERDRAILGDAAAAAAPEYAPRCLPLVFRVSPESAQVWRGVVKRSRMSGRREYIVNYVGPVREHPCIPNVYCRDGAEGEQLWDSGMRYVGSWEAHVYHGHGELVDTAGALVYRGQWERGLKHGEGSYFFRQSDIQRAYTGQWVYDEFSGTGELRVLDQSLETLRRRQPYTIARYQGKFGVAKGQFAPSIDLSRLEPQKHAALVKAYFPTRTVSRDSSLSSSALLDERPLLQSSGEAPRNFAGQLYHLDGSDLAHCGPDESCKIKYVDGTQYVGPCLAGAVPHGERALLIEPNGTRYEGGFDHGQRVGPAVVTLANGAAYEGQFVYPSGRREGEGKLTVPPERQKEAGFASYSGQFKGSLREGVGQVTLPDGAVYRGEFRTNQRHGHGCLTQASGVVYEGPWVADKIGDGIVSILYSTGHCYSGEASGGVRNGRGILLEPNGAHWAVVYEGEWKKDRMHGEGTLFCPDGVYTGEFAWGDREGHGSFEYTLPKPDSELPPLPSSQASKEPAPIAVQRVYDGEWKSDQQHGRGSYIDEYGYELADAVCERGALKNERRPGRKGLRERLLYSAKPDFAPFAVQPSGGKRFPSGSGLFTSSSLLLAADPPCLQGMDTGVGYAHGRSRPAHLGFEGVPGSRWA